MVAENFKPGVMAKYGLDYATLSRENPRLIYVTCKGFLPGPYEHRTALDEVVQMMGGLAYMTGRPGDPLRAGTSVNDLMGGQVQFGVLSLPAVLPHVRSGALKALGLCGGQRSDLLPELPTLAEQGVQGYEMEGWFALIGPAGIAEAQADRLYKSVREAFATPEVREAMAAQGNRIDPRAPADSRDFFKSEMQKYAAVVQAAQIQPQ